MGPALRHACQARYFRARGGAVDRILSDVRPKCAAPYKKTGGCEPPPITIAATPRVALGLVRSQPSPSTPSPHPPAKPPPQIERVPPTRGHAPYHRREYPNKRTPPRQ